MLFIHTQFTKIHKLLNTKKKINKTGMIKVRFRPQTAEANRGGRRYKGTAVKGTAVTISYKGTAVKGTAVTISYKGTAVKGTAVKGTAVKGAAVKVTAVKGTAVKIVLICIPHIAPCKGIQASCGFRIPKVGFRIPCLWILDSKHFKIPDSKVLISGFRSFFRGQYFAL